jgi:hypothetical protein
MQFFFQVLKDGSQRIDWPPTNDSRSIRPVTSNEIPLLTLHHQEHGTLNFRQVIINDVNDTIVFSFVFYFKMINFLLMLLSSSNRMTSSGKLQTHCFHKCVTLSRSSKL